MEKVTVQTKEITNYKEIYKLEKEKDLLNQLVGELRESKKELQVRFEDKAKDDKVIVINKNKNIGIICPSCGFNCETTGRCPHCGYYFSKGQSGTTNEAISYKNLDDVVETIRKDESKRLKLDNQGLEEDLDDAKIKVSKTEHKLEKVEASVKEQVTEAKDKLKALHKRDTEHYEKQAENLRKELSKVKSNKTDKEVEAARKQEIVDLKERITELEQELIDAGSINIIKRAWRKMTNLKAKKIAIKEIIVKKDRVKEISNNYPKGHGFWDIFNTYVTPTTKIW